MKKIVVIGGGSGLSQMLRGIKLIQNIELSAIVTVADDGGSTGRLRRQFHIPAMGDIRNVMCAMAEDESFFRELMDYRFGGNEDVGGHNLGNLILTALSDKEGSFLKAIQTVSNFLKVKGKIIPCSLEILTLYARMEDGTIVKGESNIPKYNNRIQNVYYDHETIACNQAIKAINEADYIVYGIGSLYTSVIPNLIINGVSEAISKSKATKIYFANAMTQPGESDGYSLEEHVRAIWAHSDDKAVDIVVTHTNVISDELKAKYDTFNSIEVKVKEDKHAYDIIYRDILTFDEGLIRHDSMKVKQVLEEVISKEGD